MDMVMAMAMEVEVEVEVAMVMVVNVQTAVLLHRYGVVFVIWNATMRFVVRYLGGQRCRENSTTFDRTLFPPGISFVFASVCVCVMRDVCVPDYDR